MNLRWLACCLLPGLAWAGPADAPLAAGLASYRAGRFAEAREAFAAALDADPSHLSARFWRAQASAALERWDEAVADLQLVLAGKADSAASWAALGRALAALGRTDEARAALERAVALDPQQAEAAKLLAELRSPAATPARPAAQPGAGLLLGPRVGYDATDVRLTGSDIAVEGRRLYDYTFGSAPTDWEPQGGEWAISSRYACEPEWSFYGGRGRGICAVWNKRRFRGDIAVEAYVAFIHGLPWASEQWHYQPSDLNLNLHSERGNLGSGYSFIYSGRNGSETSLRQGSRVLAATRALEDLVPQFSDLNPLREVDDDGKAFGRFHRHWWRIEARRAEGRITYTVDGRQVLTAADPTPEAEGHVALWTMGSGMVIARVRIAYEQEVLPEAPAVVVARPVPLDGEPAEAGRVARR